MNRRLDIEAALALDEATRLEASRIQREGRQAAELSRLRNESKALRHELSRTQQQLDAMLALGKQPVKPMEIKPTGRPHEAAFVLLCSDWHVGETVLKDAVSGRNEFNPAIATKRVDKLIEGALWMMEAWRAGKDGYGWKLDSMVVWIGGDMISNYLHPDLAESNAMSPTQELLFAEQLICRMLDTFAAKAGVKRIVCPTSFGNHGRTTPDRRVSTGWANSFEWLLYNQLAHRYNGKGKVAIQVGKDEISRLDVLGHKLRFNHGDTFGYGGGVGGITIPARKWLAKLDATEKATLTAVGHWHQYLDIGDMLVNGCLIGWGAYSQRVAPYSPASQVCCLIDAKRGKRLSTELIVQ